MLSQVTQRANNTRIINMLNGTRGTDQVARIVARKIRQGSRNSLVRSTAVELVKHLPQHDKRAEAQAIFDYAERAIRYTDDPWNVDTIIGAPWLIKEQLKGEPEAADCASQTVLVGALARSLAIPVRLVVIGEKELPRNYFHIFPELEIDGVWVPADVTAATAAQAAIREKSGLGYRHPAARSKVYTLKGVPMLVTYQSAFTGQRRGVYVRPRGQIRGMGAEAPATEKKAEDKTATAEALEGGETGGKGSVWGAAFGVLKKLAVGVGLGKKARAGRLAAQTEMHEWNQEAVAIMNETKQFEGKRIDDVLHSDFVKIAQHIKNRYYGAMRRYRAEAGI